MALPYIVAGSERAEFLRCRRAWDLGARERRNLEPRTAAPSAGLHAGLVAALTVYYFPGMWDWPSTIVLPLARRALDPAVDPAPAMLEAYFAWAPTVDEFAPVLVGDEVDVRIPDPRRPGRDLGVSDRPVHYRDRVDALVIDAENRYWLLEHRLVDGPWPDFDSLRLDDRCLSWCWAWEQAHPGMEVAGTIHNELQVASLAAGPPPGSGPRGTVAQNQGTYLRPWSSEHETAPLGFDLRVQLGDGFRRVHMPRERAELSAFGERIADQVATMTDPATPLYPSPAVPRCAPCPFRDPCLTMERGGDAQAVLAAGFRPVDRTPRPGSPGGGGPPGRGYVPPSR